MNSKSIQIEYFVAGSTDSQRKDSIFDWEMMSEPLCPSKKKVHVVDGGLTMNIPVPAVLRPNRKVDILLTFDFSLRSSDFANPFEVFFHYKYRKLYRKHAA